MRTTDDSELWGFIILVGAAVFLAPVFFPRVIANVEAWLLQRSVLVGANEAMVTIPGMDAGLDVRRVVVLIAAVVALIALTHGSRRARRQKESVQ